MPLVNAKCTNCGAILEVDNTKDADICSSCGLAFVVAKAINNYLLSENSAQNSTVHSSETSDFVIVEGMLLEYKGNNTNVVIPNEVEEIGGTAFRNRKDLTGIVIPNSVTSIGEYSFSGCTGLTSIVIPSNVKVWDNAFRECLNLVKVVLPQSVLLYYKYDKDHPFSDCPNLSSASREAIKNAETIRHYS